MTAGTQRFVGRAAELGELVAAIGSSRGGVLLVAGEAGIGKSRLVAEALAGTQSAAVWGSCWQGDGAPVFWPWAQVVRACLESEAGTRWRASAGAAADDVMAIAAEGDLGPLAPDASRFRMFEGVTRLLEVVAAADGLVVVLDDLHWADEASLRLFGFAARALQQRRPLFVGTYRDDEIGPDHPLPSVLAELAARVRHLHLAGLDADELGHFARAQVGEAETLAPGLIAELHGLTGGNPFFAREVLSLVRGRSRPGGQLHVPAGVRAVIQRRLARLSNACEDALKLAAVIGTVFSVDDLAAASNLPVRDVLGLLDAAVAAHVVVVDDRSPGQFRFAHDLLRETIYESVPPASRVGAHARVAAALQARRGGREPSPAVLAHHLIGAVPLVEPVHAVEAAMRAGQAAMAVLANEEASEWFECAARLARAHLAEEAAVVAPLLALGAARLGAGGLPRARDAYVEAANIARRYGRVNDLASAALGLGAGFGGFEVTLFDPVQIDLLEEALSVVGPDDSPMRVQLLARLSVALSFVAEERRLDLGTQAVAMARRLGDPSALGYALAAYCDAISGPDQSEARKEAAAEVVTLGLGGRDRRLELLGRRLLIVALLELGEIALVDTQIQAFSAGAEAIRDPLYRWYVPLWRGMRALMSGRVEESVAWCDEAEVIGAMAHSVNAAMLTLTQRWVRLRVEGRLVEAAALIEEKGFEVFGELAGSYAAAALSRLHSGDVDEARSRLREFAARLDQIPMDAEWLPTIAQLAEVAAVLGDRSSAAILDEAMAPFDGRVVVEGIGAAVYGTLGGFRAPLVRLLGRDDEARDLTAAAARAAAGMGLAGVPRRPSDGSPLDGVPGEFEPDLVAVATREAGTWVLTFGGRTGRVRDSKGLHDIATLLARPGVAVHVSELMNREAPDRAVVLSRGVEVLDRRAIGEFRRRLAELDSELAEAEEHRDDGRAAKLSVEREFLLSELAGAAGLGGRSRRVGDEIDRARKAVRARVRDALARIESGHPELGRHLARSVRTGTFCTYDPEHPVRWTIRP